MSSVTITCDSVAREFLVPVFALPDDESGGAVIGRKDVVYNRRIDKRHIRIPRSAAKLYRDAGNVLMLNNHHTTAPVTLRMNGDIIKVQPQSQCSVASGAEIVLNGAADSECLSVVYDFGKNVFTADTEAGSETEDDEAAPKVVAASQLETQLETQAESQVLPI